MEEKELLTRKFMLVEMDDAKISTEEKTIIGTDALATCHGVLLYSEDKKVAIVAHVSCDGVMTTLDKIFNLIIKNKLLNTKFKYKIFSGYYPEDNYDVVKTLEKHFKHFIPFNKNEIPSYALNKDEETCSCEFAFDACTGQFVTDKVYFGTYYYAINNEQTNVEVFNSVRKK